MGYSSNPLLPKARGEAVRLVVEQHLPAGVAARKSGVHRTTIWRWIQQWTKLNEHVQRANQNRPNRTPGTVFRQAALSWCIPTRSSRPHSHPHAVSDAIVERVLQLRTQLKRCAEVIWYHLTRHDRVCISLSSVRRILSRYQAVAGRKKRVRWDNPKRPLATKPGELVQTDTIHYICPLTKRRRYVYTVIDLYTRMAYAEACDRIGPAKAAETILRASRQFGFGFALVQADNGPEFGRYFAQVLGHHGMSTRHTRLSRPNDNAHIERFNRTVQEECLGSTLTYRTGLQQIQTKLTHYLKYYNEERVHLGLQLRTPAEVLQRS